MIVSLPDVKAHLNITDSSDDALISAKVAAAESFLNRRLGFVMEQKYGAGAVPADLQEAIKQLAAHWYENREAIITGTISSAVPIGVADIIDNYRDWSF